MTRALLLLPVYALPVERNDLWKQYQSAIEQTLEATKPSAETMARLDVALLFVGGTDMQRSHVFSNVQTLLADVYTLICSIASRLKIDLDFEGGLDVRCFAIDAPYNLASSDHQPDHYNGPISTARALLSSRMPYEQNYCLETIEKTTSRFPAQFRQQSMNSSSWKVVGGASSDASNSEQQTISQTKADISSSKTHTRVAVGGTFDHLHIGHKLLLTATVLIAQPGLVDREITIGITGDELLVNKKHAGVLESWDTRQQRCAEFVESILVFDANVSSHRQVIKVDEPGPNGKIVKVVYSSRSTGKVTINYTQISDPFGPTITDESITALVISGETRAGGKAVNDKRIEKGWHALEVFEVDVLDAGAAATDGDESSGTKSTFESKISSTEIRRRLTAAEATK